MRHVAVGGKRSDLGGRYFRSKAEANYARYLDWLKARGKIAAWDYEPRTFVFDGITRGCREYTPDFLVTLTSGEHEWHEAKGWMDRKSATKLDRFKRYYPTEKLVLRDAKWFRDAARLIAPSIPGWERG